jgi:hypothetical protein
MIQRFAVLTLFLVAAACAPAQVPAKWHVLEPSGDAPQRVHFCTTAVTTWLNASSTLSHASRAAQPSRR